MADLRITVVLLAALAVVAHMELRVSSQETADAPTGENGALRCHSDACWRDAVSKLHHVTEELETMKETVRKLESEVLALQVSQEVFVSSTQIIGFRAALNTGKEVFYAEPVKFNSVRENHGGGYDPSTGKFTCSVSGHYNFAVHLMSKTTYMEFNMIKNDQSLAHMLLQPHDTYYYSDSVSVNVYCEKGEKVWVAGSWPQGGSTTLHSAWNHFSGALVQADTETL